MGIDYEIERGIRSMENEKQPATEPPEAQQLKVSPELAETLRAARREVDAFEPWQRSRDPQGADAQVKPAPSAPECLCDEYGADLCSVHGHGTSLSLPNLKPGWLVSQQAAVPEEECRTCGGSGEIWTEGQGDLPCPACTSRELNSRIAALTAQLQQAKRDLAAMTEDRNLYRDEHEEDCPCAARAEQAERDLEQARNAALEEAAKAVPASWLDPLLSGPGRVVAKSPRPEIETLLAALASRIRALKNEQGDAK